VKDKEDTGLKAPHLSHRIYYIAHIRDTIQTDIQVEGLPISGDIHNITRTAPKRIWRDNTKTEPFETTLKLVISSAECMYVFYIMATI
jgi:hypothetical protein